MRMQTGEKQSLLSGFLKNKLKKINKRKIKSALTIIVIKWSVLIFLFAVMFFEKGSFNGVKCIW